MAKVNIEITSYYNKDNNFEAFNVEGKDETGPLFGGNYNCVKPIAEEILFEANYFKINNPEYKIRLSEGIHPLRKCGGNCSHARYTQRPDRKIKEELIKLLNNHELIVEAKKSYEDFKDNPPKITFCHLEELI